MDDHSAPSPSPARRPQSPSQTHAHTGESPVATPAKRKLDDVAPSSAEEHAQSEEESGAATREALHAHLRSLSSFLKKYDYDVDALKVPLPAHDEPESKRTRLHLDQSGSQQSIEVKVLAGTYDTFQSFVADLDAASAIVIENRRARDQDATPLPPNTPSLQDVINRTRILRKHVDNYAAKNSLRDEPLMKSANAASTADAAAATPSPALSTTDPAAVPSTHPLDDLHPREDNLVLTLHGAAFPRPKQLFSSLALPTATAQIKEESLPPGISLTHIIPYNPSIDPSARAAKPRTFADVFAPRATLPQLEPPPYPPARPHNVPWVDRHEAVVNARVRAEERTGYLYNPIPSGRWIQYGYGEVVRAAIRKAGGRGERDGRRRGPFRRHLREVEPAFANAYAGFAPGYESAGALVGRGVRERMWWEMVGAGRVGEAVRERGGEVDGKEVKKEVELEAIDDALLEEAVGELKEDVKIPVEEEDTRDATEKDLDEVLESISDLIQTLNSYRQLRNLAPPRLANPGSQTPASVASTAHLASAAAAATPSPEELMTYETLKSSLAAMVATLPPYALAKFNSDQLAELSVSKALLIKGHDHPGTLEEDEYTLQQRHYRLSQPPPQAAGMPTPGLPRPPPRAPMAYQHQPTAPAANPAAQITYQRPYAPSSRMMKPIPSTAPPPPAAPYHQGMPPQAYAAARPPLRATHPHAQAPYAPSPAYANQPQPPYQPAPVPLPAAQQPNGGPAPAAYLPAQRLLSPAAAAALPAQPGAGGGYYAPHPPLPGYQLNPLPAAPASPYVASPARAGGEGGMQPRYYAPQQGKPLPRPPSGGEYVQAPVGAGVNGGGVVRR